MRRRPAASRCSRRVRTSGTVAIVPLTGDRGLAGGFNAQIIRRALAVEREARGDGQDVRWLVAGKKGRSTLRFRRYDIEQAWIDFTDRPDYADAAAIARKLSELFIEREVDRVVARLQPLRVAADADRGGRGRAADPAAGARGGRGEVRLRDRARGRLHLRARAGDHPRAAPARLPRDDDLPRAPRVGGLGARRPDDGDAEREPERRRAGRPADARHEPSPPGGDHAGAPRGRRRRGRARG